MKYYTIYSARISVSFSTSSTFSIFRFIRTSSLLLTKYRARRNIQSPDERLTRSCTIPSDAITGVVSVRDNTRLRKWIIRLVQPTIRCWRVWVSPIVPVHKRQVANSITLETAFAAQTAFAVNWLFAWLICPGFIDNLSRTTVHAIRKYLSSYYFHPERNYNLAVMISVRRVVIKGDTFLIK